MNNSIPCVINKITMKIDKAAEYLGISDYMLRKLTREGKIPHIRAGALYLYRKDALDQWMQEQEINSINRKKQGLYGAIRKIEN